MKTGILRPLSAARWTSGQRAVNIDNMNTRILLVEDDERLAELTAEYLTKNDLKVSIEPRGDTAEARILAEQPDLVILDYHLNGINPTAINGIEALDEIKKINSNIPVVMLSSQDKIEVAVNCMHHHAFDYVVKSETAFMRLQKIIETIGQFQKIEKSL